MKLKYKRVCRFCSETLSKKHLCSKMYTYNNIFKNLLMSIYLRTKPKNGVDFFREVMKTITDNGVFTDSPDPSDVVRENLIYFMTEYDCF